MLSTPAATDTMSGNPCTIHLGVGEQRMLRELRRLVNRDVLLRLWPSLVWDRRIVQAWEQRFPELK